MTARCLQLLRFPHPVLSIALRRCAASVLSIFLLSLPLSSFALEEMAEGDLRDATGAGLAFTLTDVALRASPTSFLEFIGGDETNAAGLQYRRADLRWYGISYTGDTPLTSWSGTCTSGIQNMGCPMGGTIANLAPADNPLILRAFDYTGTLMDGTVNSTRSVIELLLPSRHEAYRFAFWGELNVGTGSTKGGGATATTSSAIGDGSNRLQVQNIWSNIQQGGSVLRLFQTSLANTTTDPTLAVDQNTFGIQWINRFSANIRFSVAQSLFSPDTYTQTPEFDDTEGLYMINYRVFMSLGQLHYQSTVLDDVPAQNGNFQIRLTQLPNQSAVYNEHYGRTSADDPTGGFDRTKNTSANYIKSHNFLRIGDYAPNQVANNATANPYSPPGFNSTDAPISSMKGEVDACMADRPGCSAGGPSGRNTASTTADGVFFVAAPGEQFTVYAKSPNFMYDGDIDEDLNHNAPKNNNIPAGYSAKSDLTRINLGDVNIQGLMIHSMTLTTLGAQ